MEFKTGSRIQNMIIEMITDGSIPPGFRLPSERALAERFSVSRNTVREAIRALAEKDILSVRRGAGAYVRDRARDRISRELKTALEKKRLRLAEIFEVRKMLEPGVAAKVAETATREDRERLAAILERQARALEQGEDPTPFDLAFHEALVRLTGNNVLSSIYATLDKVLQESRAPGIRIPERAGLSLASHSQILRAISLGDATAAAGAMTRHMNEIQTMLNDKILNDKMSNDDVLNPKK